MSPLARMRTSMVVYDPRLVLCGRATVVCDRAAGGVSVLNRKKLCRLGASALGRHGPFSEVANRIGILQEP
jgi:hypothetical protein